MSSHTKIQWTQNDDGTPGKSWNPVRGCSVISPGCVHCYAMKQAHRFSGAGKAYEGLTKQTKAGPQWTGVVRTVETALLQPLSWRKPCRVFVNSMSDLFHEDVPDAFIDQVFAVMALAPRHTFQILTKRPARMRDYLLTLTGSEMRMLDVGADASGIADAMESKALDALADNFGDVWPMPNVWLGVSVEDQKHADERIPLLLHTPAALRFISAEPLLSAVDLYPQWMPPTTYRSALPGLDWVIVGGESGPGARPCDLAWIRSIVQQCKAAGIACFVKQLGTNPHTHVSPYVAISRPLIPIVVRDRKGGDISEWPEDLSVREFPEAQP